ncbi:MAG: hypothetical protein AB1529_08130 [Candidatus Micrarchaeota archaeon]
MKDVRIRLLYPSSVRPEEVRAAMRGMDRFRDFGALHDCAELGRGDRAALRGVRNGSSIKSILASPAPVVRYADLLGDISELFVSKEILALGLTPSPMSEFVGEEFSTRLERRVGVSRECVGAVVSLSQARAMEGGMQAAPYRNLSDPGLALRSVELAVRHELGHVFGKRHCRNEGCLMQENRDFPDFIERFVRKNLDFCRDCSAAIGSFICRWTSAY